MNGTTATLRVTGMTCGHCEKAVAQLANSTEGVTNATANRLTESLTFTYNHAITSVEAIATNINQHSIYQATIAP